MEAHPLPLLDSAVEGFAAVLGEQVQERRTSVGMPAEMFALLRRTGVAMTPDDIARLEAGAYPDLTVRLLVALVFLLEVSLDRVMVICFERSGKKQNPWDQ